MTPIVADQLQTDTVLGAEIVTNSTGAIVVLPWDDTTHPGSPAARDLARAVGVDA